MATTPPRAPLRFNLRTVLGVVTAACVLLAILHYVLPRDTPTGLRIIVALGIATCTSYAAWMYARRRRHPWETPPDFVTVKVDAKWRRRVRSPVVMGPIAALTGVAVTFAPLYLFWSGRSGGFGIVDWIAVPACFLMIYLVPGFYMRLATEVMAELYKPEAPAGDEGGPALEDRM